MKKILLMALAAFAFVACGDDNNDGPGKIPGLPDPTGSGNVSFAGESYNLGYAVYDFGEDVNPSEGTTSVVLSLATTAMDFGITLKMWVDEDDTKLMPGVYSFDNSQEAGTFEYASVMVGDLMNEEYDAYAEVISGTVTVGLSGTTYTIALNLTTEDGDAITGTYTGKLLDGEEFEDEEPNGPDEPGEPGEPGGDGTMSGNISVDGTDYEAVTGLLTYVGQFEPGEGENVDLAIVTEGGSTITLELYVPEGNLTLVDGTYTFAPESYAAFTIEGGILFNTINVANITGGTITVEASGDGFTINFDLESEIGDVAGTVFGTPVWMRAPEE